MEHSEYVQSIRRMAPFRSAQQDFTAYDAAASARALRQASGMNDKRGLSMNENKIEIKDMNLYYGDFHALHDIDLDIKANEITAFIGPSGCGSYPLLKKTMRWLQQMMFLYQLKSIFGASILAIPPMSFTVKFLRH